MNVHFSSACDEWGTPDKIISLVHSLFFHIDLDPCANESNTVADKFFTKVLDGVKSKWHGKVYVNPPYGRDITSWVKKAVTEYELGNVDEIILLVPSRTDTSWFRILRKYPRCFVFGRIVFNGASNGAPFPSMIVYLGKRQSEFAVIFGAIGDIYCLDIYKRR